MPRPAPPDPNDAGQDSFLDVVSNIVGILIILVMVVGGRVRHLATTAATAPVAEAGRLEREIEELAATVASTESEIDDLQSQSRVVASAAAFAGDARLALTTALSAARVGLGRMRQETDDRQVAAAAAAVRRGQLEAELADVGKELEAARQAPAAERQVLAYPTPIGRTVNGEEIHFRIAGDRVAYIPLEELFGLAKQRTQRHSGSIAALQSRIETVGPEQGFTLDYVIEAKIDQARGQVLVRSREWVVRPATAEVGETVDEALAAGSRFRAVLATVRPETTITLWCYPDGFAGYRRIREELHRLDVPTAGRPLPDGAPIGGSTEGSKSVVQ
jgi:cell division protein FtsB